MKKKRSIGMLVFIVTLIAMVFAGDQMDIVDTAASRGDFVTFDKMLKAADLVETLKGDGPFTVFAPTDAAFAKLGDEKLEELMMPENNDELSSILTYHVVPGKYIAADFITMSEAKTVNGKSVEIRIENGMVVVDDSKVMTTDIECSNGIMHVIDTVLMP